MFAHDLRVAGEQHQQDDQQGASTPFVTADQNSIFTASRPAKSSAMPDREGRCEHTVKLRGEPWTPVERRAPGSALRRSHRR